MPTASKSLSAAYRFFRRCSCSLRGYAFPRHTSTERQYRKSWLEPPKGVPAESPDPLRLVPTRQVCTLNLLQGGDSFPSICAELLLWREAPPWQIRPHQW